MIINNNNDDNNILKMYLSIQICYRKYPKLKEVDDVLGGAEAWENVDSTEGMLCAHNKQ